jgi:D-threo-aldose 1-dehydrogenase
MDVTTPRRVGKSRLEVAPLGFGAGPLGDRRVSAQACLETVRAAWDGGVRFYDTAPYYGIGRSERRLGVALAECGPRESFQVNTKVGRTLEPEPVRDESRKTFSPDGQARTPRDGFSGHRVHFDYSEAGILAQHRDSLGRMGLPYVDSLAIHDVDYGHQWPEQVDAILTQLSRTGGGGARALEGLREAGLIAAIGAGCNREMRNYDTWEGGRHEDLIERLLDTVDLDFLILAGPYTLLDTIALRRVLPLMQARGVGAIIASPFAGGWLIDPEAIPYMYGQTPDHVRERTARLAALCRSHDAEIGAVALRFVLAHPAVAAVIPGAKTATEAREARRLLEAQVTPDLWAALKAQGLLDEAAPTPPA